MTEDSCQTKAGAGKKDACRARNAEATREAILQAARGRFMREGYDQASLRAIAGDAGVDAALISRYFGCKEQLFANVLESVTKDPMGIVAGERAGFGERMARAMLSPEDRSAERKAFIGLITHSASTQEAAKLVRLHIEKQFLTPFSQWLGGEQAREKASLTASVLMGVTIMNEIRPTVRVSVPQLAALLQFIVDQPAPRQSEDT